MQIIEQIGKRVQDRDGNDITVELVGQNGNAFAVMGAVQKAMRRGGVPKEIIDKYMVEATSGNYDHLLRVTMEYVEVE